MKENWQSLVILSGTTDELWASGNDVLVPKLYGGGTHDIESNIEHIVPWIVPQLFF